MKISKKIEGFVYYESYCWADCMEHRSGWCITKTKPTFDKGMCDECEDRYSRCVLPDGKFVHQLEDGVVYLIETSIGRELIDGDYISCSIEADAYTLEDIIVDNSL